MTLKRIARASPGCISSQKKSAIAAMKSSTAMPAAPTITRRRFSGNALAAEASTYGTGISTSSMIPISWTSPPQALTAHAWPNSCSALTSGNTSARRSRFSGARTRCPRSLVSSSQCRTARSAAVPTTAAHKRKPAPPKRGRYQRSVRSRSRSGSRSGMRTASGDISLASRWRRPSCCERRSSSSTSGDTSHWSTSAAWSCPMSWITSSWLGASSPKRSSAACQIASTGRRPFISPRTKCAAGPKRCARRESWSVRTYQRSPRYSWRWMRACERSRGCSFATRYHAGLSGWRTPLVPRKASRQPRPGLQPDPVERLVRPDPREPALVNEHLRHALHAGTQPRARVLRVELRLDAKDVAALGRAADRRDLAHREAVALARHRGEHERAPLALAQVGDAVLVHLQHHAVGIERRDFEERLPAVERRAERLRE